jgi:Fe-Mn family superoxide dismutase
MHHPIEPIHCRPWLLNGFSLKLFESHYENNYGGAVRKLNAIGAQLSQLDFAKAPPALVNGLKREELSALNSTLLHELYFASLGGEGKPGEAMAAVLAHDFGSADRWRAEFVAMAHALAGGSGWVVLGYIPRDRRLVNQSASEHTQAVAGAIPVLALDMYEHAYHIDFGANAKAYVDAFMRNIDWRGVEERYGDACKVEPPRPLEQREYDIPGIDVEEVRSLLANGQPVKVIDVRPRHYLSRQQDIAEGISWRDPDRIQDWIGELSKSEPVVVYCAYGFHVGCKTAIALHEAGFDARFMKGGHSAWKASGAPTKVYSEPAVSP